MIDVLDTENVIEKCFGEMEAASLAKYDAEKAEKTASLFLLAQMKLSFLIEEVELKSRSLKNAISKVEGEVYFTYKTSSGEKKTEKMIEAHVAKDTSVSDIKQEAAKQEAALKKWVYVMNTLKDGHVYFRNIGKAKTWAE